MRNAIMDFTFRGARFLLIHVFSRHEVRPSYDSPYIITVTPASGPAVFPDRFNWFRPTVPPTIHTRKAHVTKQQQGFVGGQRFLIPARGTISCSPGRLWLWIALPTTHTFVPMSSSWITGVFRYWVDPLNRSGPMKTHEVRVGK